VRLVRPTVPANLKRPEQVVAFTAGSVTVRLDVSQAAVIVQADDPPFIDRLTHKYIHKISIVYPAESRSSLSLGSGLASVSGCRGPVALAAAHTTAAPVI
jgi:hypothetical protein